MRTTLPALGARLGDRRALAAFLLGWIGFSVFGCTLGVAPRYAALRKDVAADVPEAVLLASAPPLPGGQLTRQRLIREVLERNPSVRAAEYTFRAALARYPQSTALDDPELAYGVAPWSFGSSTVNDAHKVELKQRLPFPGKLELRGEAALARAEAAAHDLETVRLELASVTSTLLDDYVYVGRAIEINDEHAALVDEFKAVAIARYEAGMGSQQDPLQAETELAHIRHQGVVLRTNRQLVAQRINTLLRRPPEEALPASLASLPPLELPEPATDAVDLALERRPELRAASYQVAAEEASVALAQREFFPDVTLVGAYNSLWQEDDLQPFVGLSIDVPLQIGRRRAALREARADLGRAQAVQARVADDVRLSVAQARARLGEAEHVLMLYRDRLLPPAEDRVVATRAAFETGRGSFLALIDAERNVRTTTLGFAKARAELSQARATWLRAVGLHAAEAREGSAQ